MPLGRPRSLDGVKRGEICALLNAGLQFLEAARYVGCTARTIRREMARNALFRREVHDALLAARLAPEKLLRQAAGRNWRAAAWLLERTDPHTYARRAAADCTLDDLDAAGRWIVEVAMQQVDGERREIMFDRLLAVVQEVKTQIAQRTNPRKPIRTPSTPFYDVASLLCQVKGPPLRTGDWSDRDNDGADKCRATFVNGRARGNSENVASRAATSGQKSGRKSA